MLRLQASVTVIKKDEGTNKKDLDFPYTEQQAQILAEQIKMKLHGVHLVDGDGNVFVFRVDTVKANEHVIEV